MSRPTSSGRRLRSIVAATSGLAIGLAAVGATALPAAAAPPSPSPREAAAAGSSHTVTLITGDRVKVTDIAGGKHTVEVTTAQPGAGVKMYEAAGDLHVVPDGATPYVAAGLLDPDLFNVSLLIEYGYDDASVAATPIIVEQDAAGPRTFSAPLPGLDVQAELLSIDAAAATIDHTDTAAAWQALTAPTARSLSAGPSLAGGIAAIHLDGKVKATLDSSVPYIDAPEAWAEGYTGAGVTVAVLDTGIDDTHPDLQGHIASDSKSFVPGEDVYTDIHGHGTHVASTVAGTGAASGGKNRGVADGATLLIGKVLGGADGTGQDSWIIEGMEWAGRHAPIVSMSLGSFGASDGKDIMSEALDKISAETGALFVVAAGNSGAPETVGSPGAAEQALTVGSVDDPSGALSYFSSQGPLSRSGAMKPDLTGPGNNVTAARSADSPGDGSYVTMSGTSMATPHVAGAAAIVKQKHPEYTAAQLRAALVSTTTDVGYTPYQGGTGVVNVAAAIDAPVIASGSGDFGMLMWGEEPTPVVRRIDFTNRSDAEVTVALDASLKDTTPSGGDGGPGPLSVDAAFNALTMDADSLTIPAGETRSLTMTVDPAKVPAGTQLSGVLVGSFDGKPVTRTALGTIAEAERYDLHITSTDFAGEQTLTYAWLWNADEQIVDPVAVEGETTLRLMKGNYSVMSYMELDRTPDTKAEVLVGDPHITLDKDSSVALDARTAQQVTLDLGKRGLDEAFRRMDFTADGLRGSAIMPVWTDEMWAQPMKPTDADVDFTTRWRVMKPMLTVAAGRKQLDTIIQAGSTFLDGKLSGRAVNAGKGSVADVQAAKVAGKIAVVTRSEEVSASRAVANAATAGAKMVILANNEDAEFSSWVGSEDFESSVAIPVAGISGVEGRALLGELAKKPVTVDAVGVRYSDVIYDIARFSDGQIPADLHYAPKKLARIDTTYYGKKEEMGEFRADFAPKVGYSGGYPMRALRGMTRAEWVNTDQVQWNQDVMILDDWWEMRDTLRTYKPGQHIETGYYGGIVRPYVATGYWVPYRTSAFAQVNIPGWGDGIDSAHTGSFDTYAENAPVQQLTDVWIDGVQHAASKYQGANVSDIPDGTHNWHVVSAATHDGSHIPSSTKTVSEWNFTATGAVDDYEFHLLPMIQAYYDVEIGKDGRVGADRRKGSSVTLGLELGHVAGADDSGRITGATLEARTAGGKWTKISLRSAWTDAPKGAVAGDGGTFVKSRAYVSAFTGQVPVSDKGGWVDLRVTAKDAAGNTFSQEITKAFEATPVKGHDGGHGPVHGHDVG
ncbi:S8 family serine peptidase [Microbacterium deminutum]|uniref:S8 family serine peptidase n=1 Tax=Microbacterium deminutum TaxID=344164 RepID=A0ABP5C7R6_9MICO